MAEAGEKDDDQFREITECSICMSAFTDPRMLPCIHTFCFECLKRTLEATQKKPGENMPCPLCRKEFIISEDGMNGVQKNFFIENLLLHKATLQLGSVTIICDVCKVRKECKLEHIPKATMRCFECQDNYCESCVEVHKLMKLSKGHQLVHIGSETKAERSRLFGFKSCPKHVHKLLDYYCAKCKKIVCVSCFVESHKSHDCVDVTTVEEGFRETIEQKALKISECMDNILSAKRHTEKKREDFVKQIVEKEEEIQERNKELKDLIDRHTKSLLDELSVIKSDRLKEIETMMEEIETEIIIFSSFEAYCNELRSIGSASDICSSVDQVIARAFELEKEFVAFVCRPEKLVDVTFQVADLRDVIGLPIANSDSVGKVEVKTETIRQNETFAVFVGFDCPTITDDVVKIIYITQEEEFQHEDKLRLK